MSINSFRVVGLSCFFVCVLFWFLNVFFNPGNSCVAHGEPEEEKNKAKGMLRLHVLLMILMTT